MSLNFCSFNYNKIFSLMLLSQHLCASHSFKFIISFMYNIKSAANSLFRTYVFLQLTMIGIFPDTHKGNIIYIDTPLPDDSLAPFQINTEWFMGKTENLLQTEGRGKIIKATELASLAPLALSSYALSHLLNTHLSIL